MEGSKLARFLNNRSVIIIRCPDLVLRGHFNNKDLSAHPYARRLDERHRYLVQDLNRAIVPPRKAVNIIRGSEPEVLITRKDVSNQEQKQRVEMLAGRSSTEA